MSNIETLKKEKSSSFRKLAIGSWGKPKNPTIYAKLTFDYSNCKTYLKESGLTQVSVNHVVAKALATIFKQYPYLNRVLIRRSIYVRKHISAFFNTHLRLGDDYDLLGVTIQDIDRLSLSEIEKKLKEKVLELRQNKNKEMKKSKFLIQLFPSLLTKPVIKVFDFFMYSLNIDFSKFGLSKDPYGSFIVTSIGSFGMEEAYVPLFPFSRCGMVVAVGKPSKQVQIKNGTVQEYDRVTLTFSLDHRLFDGAHFAKPLRLLKKIIEQPKTYL
ncbi:hypothetical protein DID78_00675 [Candidatus Marinamargulisbacteria bacterium SCGC AG-343-D04]|nr:hypothetical protein DID78_00675 [Candidatus Marinamargulisbacteria bacterium SCGC AG-343-D04]